MKIKNSQLIQNKVIITKFKNQFASDLKSLFSSNCEDNSMLNQGFIYDILQSARLLSHATNFVTCHVQDKTPIGFITLGAIKLITKFFDVKSLL